MQLSSLPLPQWHDHMEGYSPHACAHELTRATRSAMLSPEDSAWVETPQPLFSPRTAGPTVQRLVLGGHLRRLREEAGMTTEQAADTGRGLLGRRSAGWSTVASGSRSTTSTTC